MAEWHGGAIAVVRAGGLRRQRALAALAATTLIAIAFALRVGIAAGLSVVFAATAITTFGHHLAWTRAGDQRLIARANASVAAVAALANRADQLLHRATANHDRAFIDRADDVRSRWLRDASVSELRRYGSHLPLRAVEAAGVRSVATLADTTTEQLITIHGVGEPSAVALLAAATRYEDGLRRRTIPAPDLQRPSSADCDLVVAAAQRHLAIDVGLEGFADSLHGTAAEFRRLTDEASNDLTFATWLRTAYAIAADREGSSPLAELVATIDGDEAHALRAQASDFIDATKGRLAAIRVDDAVQSYRRGEFDCRRVAVTTAPALHGPRLEAIGGVDETGLHPVRLVGVAATVLFVISLVAASASDRSRLEVAGTSTTSLIPTTELDDAPVPVPSTAATPTTAAAPTTTAPTTTAPTTTAAPGPASTATPTTAPQTTVAALASGGCHRSYSGGCVPTGFSDVDCAGGSGNGPGYADGPLTVVGADVFGLDNDGDGQACES